MIGLRKLHLIIGFTLVPFLLVTAVTGFIYLLMPRYYQVLRWHGWFKWGGLILAAGIVFLAVSGEEAGRLVFHIDGLAEGQIGVARLPRDIYARIEADLPARLAEEPFREFCEPPYVSLRRAEFAG